MAGAGYKLFNTGDVLTAQQVNEYLMQQTVMVFANASARTTALSGVLAEGMVSYLQDTNVVEIYTGASWVSLDDPNAIQNSLLTTTGDTIYASGASTPARLGIGTAGQVLTVNSGATAPEWTTISSGGMTLISSTTFSTGTVSLTSIASTYTDLVLVISQMYGSSDGAELDIQFNTDTGANYGIQRGTTLADGQTSIRVLDMITTSVQYEKQCNGMIVIPRYSTNMRKFCQIRLSASAAATDLYSNNQGLYNSTTAISSIQLKTSAGTFSGGTVFLYGVK